MRLKPGQVLGPYKITRFIARGGMGEIYEAFEERLDRRVALKIISGKHEESENYRENLTKEARALAKVNHSNVVSVYSIDTLDGIDFIAMEYIDGIPMDKVTEKFAFDSVEVVGLCMQMLLGIKALHDRKIVHRDIKPSNILLTDQGVIKWADFGLAAVLDQVSQNTVSNLYGTPRYLSPEQLNGVATSFPSDIWCLGLVFYELFAGQKLIDPKKEMTLLEIEKFIAELSFEIPLHLKRTIHPVLQNILKQMLSNDIGHRYRSIDDVISDFRALEAKLSKEKKPEVFTYIQKSLKDYKKGWKLLGKKTRLNEFQKKRIMALSLHFRSQKPNLDDDTLNLREQEKFFTKEALDSAQHLLNSMARQGSGKRPNGTPDYGDSMIIFPDAKSGKIRMIDTSMSKKKTGPSFYKKFKSISLIALTVFLLAVLFLPKDPLMQRISNISRSIVGQNPEPIKKPDSEALSKRGLATAEYVGYPSDVTIWFKEGEPILFDWRGFRFNSEAVFEISRDARFKELIFKNIVTGSKVTVNWKTPGQYFWRVRTIDFSKTTKIHQFKALISSPPELMIPGENARFIIKETEYLNEKTIHFFWKKNEQVKIYEVQIAKTKDFHNVKIAEFVKNTQSWSAQLTPGIYYWRVRAADKGVDLGWSQTRKFDIVTEKF